jgi:Regulator of chromosome condensation (RCC1) repeat
MIGFKPVNASKLRHSTSVDSDSGSSEKISTTRRVSLPFRKDIMSKDGDNEDSGPAINKSVLRGSTSGLNAKNQLLSIDTQPTSKRQRISPSGDYVSTGEEVQSATNKSSSWSLIVKLRYRGGVGVRNDAPEFQDSDVYVTGQGPMGQMATPMRKTHKGVPAYVDILDPLDNTSVVQIACGPTHCAALTSDGSVRTWGSNALGALGRDTGRPENIGSWSYSLEQTYVPVSESAQTIKDPQVDVESIPDEVSMKAFLDGVAIVQVAVGCHKTFVLTSDGYVYAWGAFVVSIL